MPWTSCGTAWACRYGQRDPLVEYSARLLDVGNYNQIKAELAQNIFPRLDLRREPQRMMAA